MILFNLRCAAEHEFEAWFKDGATYDEQAASGEIACPVCDDTDVGKAIMAPRVSGKARKRAGPPAGPAELRRQYVSAMREVRKRVEENCDYVGPGFAEEARKIQSGDSEERGIYGEATEAEAKTLSEDGIAFNRIPWVPREDA